MLSPTPPSPATQQHSFLATNLLVDLTHLYASLSSILGFASNLFLAASAIWMSSGGASSPTSLFSGIFMAIVIEFPEICLSSPRKTEPNVPLPRNLPRVMWDAWIFRFGAISSNIWKCKNINSGLDGARSYCACFASRGRLRNKKDAMNDVFSFGRWQRRLKKVWVLFYRILLFLKFGLDNLVTNRK